MWQAWENKNAHKILTDKPEKSYYLEVHEVIQRKILVI
jgi:hypothetical protein